DLARLRWDSCESICSAKMQDPRYNLLWSASNATRRILYYFTVHGPARRGGSAWWSVGLIGYCRSLTAALLRHPKVRGSNPRPDILRRRVVWAGRSLCPFSL